MQDLQLRLRELLVRHGSIRGAEIHGAGLELTYPAARSDGLVVNLNVRVRGVVNVKPLGINRIGKGGARGI